MKNEFFNFRIFLFGFLFCILPIALYLNKVIFISMFIIIFFLLIFAKESSPEKWILLYIVSASFFGISLFSIKLYDIILIFALIYLLLIGKFKKINFAIVPFILFIAYLIVRLYLISTATTDTNYNSLGTLSLVRFLFALLACVVFSQSFFSTINIKRVINKLDLFAIFLAIQIIVMRLCYQFWGSENNFLTGPFIVNLYGDSMVANSQRQLEMRSCAFFSDPNKLMCFVLVLLLLRRFLLKNK